MRTYARNRTMTTPYRFLAADEKPGGDGDGLGVQGTS